MVWRDTSSFNKIAEGVCTSSGMLWPLFLLVFWCAVAATCRYMVVAQNSFSI